MSINKTHKKYTRSGSESDSEYANNQYEETMKILRNTMEQQNLSATRDHEKAMHPDKLVAGTKKVSRPSVASKPIGIVVRKEQRYSVIWSLRDGLMYAPEANMSLGTWVRYQCMTGEPVENGKILKFAYSCEDTVPLRITAKLELTVQVATSVLLVEDGEESSEFISVYDEVLGTILCSKDGYVLKRLKRGDELETFVAYVEDFRNISHWVVILVNRGVEDWRKMGNLPSHLDELAEVALKRYKRTDDSDDYTSQQNRTQVLQFAENLTQLQPSYEIEVNESLLSPIKNWKGVIHLTDRKISEVPALTVEHEEDGKISVLFTAFGLARLRNYLPTGTWVMITMLEDQEEDEGEPQATVAENFKLSYYVLRYVKIPPPMSTRLIKTEVGEKILLCGIVTCGQRCLENQFIGVVDDSKQRINPDNRITPTSKYLVEIGLLRSTKKIKNPLFWRVLKSHGPSNGKTTSISIINSFVPNEENDLLDRPACRNINSLSPSKDASETSETETSVKNRKLSDFVCDRPQYVETDAESNLSKENSIASDGSKQLKSVGIENPLSSLYPCTQSVEVSTQELSCYVPDPMDKKVRGLGVVVRKLYNFAFIYSKIFGLGLLNTSNYENVQDADVGQWISAYFVTAIKTDGIGKLRFNFICLPKIVPKKAVLPTRIINNFVHVEVPFEFDNTTVSRCNEEPTKLKVESVLGDALISDSTYKKLELHGTQRKFWTAYTKEKYGCHWKILIPNEVSIAELSEN